MKRKFAGIIYGVKFATTTAAKGVVVIGIGTMLVVCAVPVGIALGIPEFVHTWQHTSKVKP